MITTVIFDMDGVLIDAREWHYEALNKALGLFGLQISRTDHLTTFDGLPTKRKLEMLSINENLPRELHGFLNELKQAYTLDLVHSRCKPTFAHEYALATLKSRGLKLGLASNSVRASIEAMMIKAKLLDYMDLLLSNQDVTHAKPDPEIYLKAMAHFGAQPSETLIVEDNENGVKAARASGAHVMVVRDPSDVTLSKIDKRIGECGPR